MFIAILVHSLERVSLLHKFIIIKVVSEVRDHLNLKRKVIGLIVMVTSTENISTHIDH